MVLLGVVVDVVNVSKGGGVDPVGAKDVFGGGEDTNEGPPGPN